MGLMVMEAAKEAESNGQDTDKLGKNLAGLKDAIQTSFIVDNTEYLSRNGRLPLWLHKLCTALMVHPMIMMKDSEMTVGGILFGNSAKSRRKYVRRALRGVNGIETDTLFITHAGLSGEELQQIREEVESIVKFEHVYIQQASPAIAINCGPGSFGLIFRRRQRHEG